VQPFTNLSNAQSVMVTGHGFSANAAYGIEMCAAVVNSNNDCDPNTAQTGRTDAGGSFSVAYAITQTISTTNHGTIVCNSTGNCSIGSSNFANPNALPAANEDIGFGGTPPPTPSPTPTPNPTPTPSPPAGGGCGSQGAGTHCGTPAGTVLNVTPYTGLTDGMKVQVTGHGFSPNAVYGIEMCSPVVLSNNDCDASTAQTGRTDATGSFTATYAVTQAINTPNQHAITCSSAANCAVGSSNFGNPNALPAASETVAFAGGSTPGSGGGTTSCCAGVSFAGANNTGAGSNASLQSSSNASLAPTPAPAASPTASGVGAATSGSGGNGGGGNATIGNVSYEMPWPLLSGAGFLFLLMGFGIGALLRLRRVPGGI